MDAPDDHGDDTQGVDGHCSIQAALVGALEVSTWSARSAASTNDVDADADERRQTMARRGLALERHHGERPLVVIMRVRLQWVALEAVSYTHLRAHETVLDLVCRLL